MFIFLLLQGWSQKSSQTGVPRASQKTGTFNYNYDSVIKCTIMSSFNFVSSSAWRWIWKYIFTSIFNLQVEEKEKKKKEEHEKIKREEEELVGYNLINRINSHHQ